MINRHKQWGRVLVAACGLAVCSTFASGAVVFTDGFGDGDRDNNGLDGGAVVTDASDVGIPWYGVGGTSAITHQVVDDSAGIGTGNALQIFNTGSNNRPHVGVFSPITLNDGDKLVLSFDMRVVSLSNTSSDRSIRFGLYNGGSTAVSSDLGSTATEPNDDVGYNARVDAGPDGSNSTTMDVTRDDSSTSGLIAATATNINIGSTDTANQLDDNVAHRFVLTLERDGGSMIITLQQDGNAAITGTDTAPPTFTFDEVMVGPRSNAAMDLRYDNFRLELIPVPEPVGAGLAGLAALALGSRRRGK